MADEREDRFAKGDRKIIKDINTYGWHVVNVMPQGDDAGWAYSIGMFRTLEHPEILVFGLRDTSMHAIINHVGERVRKKARSSRTMWKMATRWTDIAACSSPFISSGTHGSSGTVVGSTVDDEFPVLQLVWPDKETHYPSGIRGTERT